MASSRKAPQQFSQTTIAFPITKSSSAQLSKSNAKNASGNSEQRAKNPVVKIETRAQAAEARAKQTVVTRSNRKRKAVVDSDAEDSDEEEFDDELSEAEEEDEPAEVVVSDKEDDAHKPAVQVSSASEDEEDVVVGKGKGKALGLKDLVRDNSFKAYHKEVKLELGGELTRKFGARVRPSYVHLSTAIAPSAASAKGESKATTILRRWDLSYEYGPCVGMTRLERWERAEKLGLNPPEMVTRLLLLLFLCIILTFLSRFQVRRILDTSKADKLTDSEVETLQQSVLHGLV